MSIKTQYAVYYSFDLHNPFLGYVQSFKTKEEAEQYINDEELKGKTEGFYSIVEFWQKSD